MPSPSRESHVPVHSRICKFRTMKPVFASLYWWMLLLQRIVTSVISIVYVCSPFIKILWIEQPPTLYPNANFFLPLARTVVKSECTFVLTSNKQRRMSPTVIQFGNHRLGLFGIALCVSFKHLGKLHRVSESKTDERFRPSLEKRTRSSESIWVLINALSKT